MKSVSVGNHLILKKIEAVRRPFFLFFSPNYTWKLLGVGANGILYCEKLVYAQMPFAVTKLFFSSSCMKSQESEGASPLGFLLRPFMLSKAGSGSWLMEQDYHCPGAIPQLVFKQAIFLVYSIFIFSPLKSDWKRRGCRCQLDSLKLPEMLLWLLLFHCCWGYCAACSAVCSCAGSPLGVSRNVKAKQPHWLSPLHKIPRFTLRL